MKNNDMITSETIMVIIERRCIECDCIRLMNHNSFRCYDCAMKRRKEMDRLRYQKRIKKNTAIIINKGRAIGNAFLIISLKYLR